MSHFSISMLKSIMRIAGSISAIASYFAFSPMVALITLATTYGLAEICGILEEIFDKRKED